MIGTTREFPGASSPWPGCDKILDPSERFCLQHAQGEVILWAPREVPCMAALLYQMHEMGLKVHVQGRGTEQGIVKADVLLSTRALSRIDDQSLEDACLSVEAGASLQDVDSLLFEKGCELGWSDWVWRDGPRSLGGIYVSRTHNGCLQGQRSPWSAILSAEGLLWDGSLVQARFPSQDWAVITSFRLHVMRRPPVRRTWAWKSSCREELKSRIAELRSMTETWERLDCVLAKSAEQKGFVLAQLAGTEEEISRLPSWSGFLEYDPLPSLRRFMRGFRPTDTLLEHGFLWEHIRTDTRWTLAP